MPGAPALSVTRLRLPIEFEDQAGPLLHEREAENNLPLGLLHALRNGRVFGGEPPFFVVVRDALGVLGAAMRTPPFNLILIAGTVERAIAPILERLASETSELTGVSGPSPLAKLAAGEWARRSGRTATLRMAQRIYRLTRVIPPRSVAGSMRPPTSADRECVAAWMHAFVAESQPYLDGSWQTARENADRWIASGRLRLWDDDGAVAMAGASGPTPNGIRVSAVYTPPEKRRRGYASALVAALSQEQLDRGKRWCFLFTDLANPTSNRIYAGIGYEPVIDVDEYQFS